MGAANDNERTCYDFGHTLNDYVEVEHRQKWNTTRNKVATVPMKVLIDMMTVLL